MAKTKLAAPLAGLRGTISGWTFSENKAGTYVKAWAQSPKLRTEKQQVQRANIGGLSQAWAALTSGQRSDWNTYAALPAQELTNSLGQAYYTTGFNWFISCSTHLLRAGRVAIASAPVLSVPTAPTITAIAIRPSGTPYNITSDGTATADASEVGYPPELAVDGIISVDSCWRATFPPTPAQWYFEPNQLYACRRMRYAPRPAPESEAPYLPALYGWTGAAYTLLGEFTYTPAPFQTWLELIIYSDTQYSKFRVTTSPAPPDQDIVAFSEIELYEDETGFSYITYPYNEWYDGDFYDLVMHAATARATGAIIAPGTPREVIVQQNPEGYYIPIQAELEEAFGTICSPRIWFCSVYRQNMEGRRSAPTTKTVES